MAKRYGLIIKGETKSTKTSFSRPAIFGSDSDDDDSPSRLGSIGLSGIQKRQARKIQEEALKQDPTIFQYDELYEEIESRRTEEKKSKSEKVNKPKYINRLLEHAERRKIENERRLERQVQKEREEEGEQFKDKESFVTSSYRTKLEELKKAEEREKREDYLEAIGDVTKQQDLGGFYRHLYSQQCGEAEIFEEIPKDFENRSKPFTATKTRAYRKRHSSDNEVEEKDKPNDEFQTKKAHLQSNLDADSDFSIDSSGSSDEEPHQKIKNADVKGFNVQDKLHLKQESQETAAMGLKNDSQIEIPIAELKSEDKERSAGSAEINNQKMPFSKKDIWQKRTVEAVFQSALQRYFERKQARTIGA